VPGTESLRGLPVLVADANPTSRRILGRMLTSLGMEPELTDSGPAAIARLQAVARGEPFPLVLLDVSMSGSDGFTLVEQIQAGARRPEAAILLTSPAQRRAIQERGGPLKAAAYLEKPITRADLLRTILGALGIAKADSTEPAGLSGLPKADKSLRILLAEDNPANQKLALYILGKRGHCVEIAHNGRQAVDKVRRQEFDLVLMDVQMPEMDGFQATSEIRALGDSRKASLPVIAMTAHALKGDDCRCRSAGMDGYISKPIDAGELIALVERMASADAGSKPQALGRVADQAEPQRTIPVGHEDKNVFDANDALAKCYGNREMMSGMIKFFFTDSAELLARMRTALRNRDTEEIANAAHRLRGTVVYLGANAAVDAAKRTEQTGVSGDLAAAAMAVEQLEDEIRLLAEAIVACGEGQDEEDSMIISSAVRRASVLPSSEDARPGIW
jgi:CheY-like chemotaxis protein